MPMMDEAARLMGAGAPVTGEALRALEAACAQAQSLPFHSLTRPCALAHRHDRVYVDGVEAPGRDLARHLCGCREGVLLGATLGVQGDVLLGRLSLRGAAWAAAAQAALSACLEARLDDLTSGLAGGRPGYHLTNRFSPGYGDLPLSFQPFLMDRLQMARLGVHLTRGMMMAPAKSVTAIAGWRAGAPAPIDKCAACGGACPYRAQRQEDRP